MIETLLELIEEVIGTYEPISYVYTVGDDVITMIPSGAAGVNWSFVAAAAVLVVGIIGAFILMKAFLQGVFRN